MPANLILEVTTLDDTVNPNDGVFSLRERIEEANLVVPTSQHTIYFKNTLWGGTSTLDPTRGELHISKHLFIDGPANKITI